MDREIKFKFWSVWWMHAVEQIDFIARQVWLSDGDQRDMDYGNLLQRTWLKDSKGKDIYEGDIVKGTEKRMGCGIVEFGWHATSDYCYASIANGRYISCDLEHPELEQTQALTQGEVYEIIWNIYENPDLLPKPTDG